jgi:hypothetical protein
MKRTTIAAVLLAACGAAAQTARLGSLPASAHVVTNADVLVITQQMLDAITATNATALAALADLDARITAGIDARTNGWAQWDTLVQQTNATVRLYQPDTPLRWAHLTQTNLAVTTLTPTPMPTMAWEQVTLGADQTWAPNSGHVLAAADGGFFYGVAGAGAAQPGLYWSSNAVDWTRRGDLPVNTESLVYMPNTSNGWSNSVWAVIFSQITFSEDEGVTWHQPQNLFNKPVTAASMANGFALATRGLNSTGGILYYSDNLKDWSSGYGNFNDTLRTDHCFFDGFSFFRYVPDTRLFIRTGFFPQTSEQLHTFASPIRQIRNIAGLFIAQEESGELLASNDGGAMWNPWTLPSSTNAYTITELRGGTAVLAQETDAAWVSLDGGATWTEVAQPSTGTLTRSAGTGSRVIMMRKEGNTSYAFLGSLTVTTNYTSATVLIPFDDAWRPDLQAQSNAFATALQGEVQARLSGDAALSNHVDAAIAAIPPPPDQTPYLRRDQPQQTAAGWSLSIPTPHGPTEYTAGGVLRSAAGDLLFPEAGGTLATSGETAAAIDSLRNEVNQAMGGLYMMTQQDNTDLGYAFADEVARSTNEFARTVLPAAVTAHDADPAAHPDIREAVAAVGAAVAGLTTNRVWHLTTPLYGTINVNGYYAQSATTNAAGTSCGWVYSAGVFAGPGHITGSAVLSANTPFEYVFYLAAAGLNNFYNPVSSFVLGSGTVNASAWDDRRRVTFTFSPAAAAGHFGSPEYDPLVKLWVRSLGTSAAASDVRQYPVMRWSAATPEEIAP